MDSFIDFCKKCNNPIMYFHNEKFDGEFILYWLLTHDFKYVKDKKDVEDKTFTCLISDMGVFYSIEVYFKKGNKKVKKVTFYDSLKIIPFSVEEIAKSFNMEISKLKIDYDKPREKGHILTKEEEDYIKNDVLIVAKALKVIFNEGLTKMTRASNALADYKKIMGRSKFEHYFPRLDSVTDKDIRKSYRGGRARRAASAGKSRCALQKRGTTSRSTTAPTKRRPCRPWRCSTRWAACSGWITRRPSARMFRTRRRSKRCSRGSTGRLAAGWISS